MPESCGMCANYKGRCSMFEKPVPAVEGDRCSECGHLLLHESGLTWADARMKAEEWLAGDEPMFPRFPTRPVLLAASVEVSAPDLPDAWMAVRQMQIKARTEASIVLRWYWPVERVVEVWDLSQVVGHLPMIGRIERTPPTEADMRAYRKMREAQVDVHGSPVE